MSALHDAFDELVADVPVYGDLDRAFEQADRERRRYRPVVALAAAAAVLAVIAGIVTISRDSNTAPPVTPSPSPTPGRTQSPQTWVDTAVAAHEGYQWDVPDPLKEARDAWSGVVAKHLDPKGDRLTAQEGGEFTLAGEGSAYTTYGQAGLIVDRGVPNLFDDGCRYLGTPDGKVSCSTERIAGPGGERGRITQYQRMCATWNPGSPGDDARPGPGQTYATCGEFVVAVAVERSDGLIGYVRVDGRGTLDYNPFAPGPLAAVAADTGLTLPKTAYTVPSDQAVASVIADHVPDYRPADELSQPPQHPGYANAGGKIGKRLGVHVSVRPAGGAPTCGRSWLIECVERRVYGAADPTTVYVGAWDEEDWADCCPRNSRADTRQFVYVGPRHTVVVSESMIVRADEVPISAALDQRLIDLALDPRLQ